MSIPLMKLNNIGKTTILTTVVNKLIDQEDAKKPPQQPIPIMYFYYKYDQKDK